MNIDVMDKITYGLFVLTAKDGEKDNGCIINTAMQVTVMPNCIVVAVNKESYTHDMISKTKEFNISILDETSQFETYKKLGFKECGRWHKARYHMGESHDVILMELFRDK